MGYSCTLRVPTLSMPDHKLCMEIGIAHKLVVVKTKIRRIKHNEEQLISSKVILKTNLNCYLFDFSLTIVLENLV